jgi:hypothetical protein
MYIRTEQQRDYFALGKYKGREMRERGIFSCLVSPKSISGAHTHTHSQSRPFPLYTEIVSECVCVCVCASQLTAVYRL